MTSRVLRATVGAPAGVVLRHLADDAAFAAHAADLTSVTASGDGTCRWVLAFRGRTASWTQATRASAEVPERIEFAQLRGDFQHLLGAWTVTGGPDGCEVTYEVDFATNVPHLAGAIDSAVGRVLVRVAHDVLAAVGPVRITAGQQYLRDLDPAGLETHGTTAERIRHG